MSMITFAESTTNSLSQITGATLAANLFRHYLQCCMAFYFRARGARCSCPFSSEIRGRTSITAFAPGRGKPLLCQWALRLLPFPLSISEFCLFVLFITAWRLTFIVALFYCILETALRNILYCALGVTLFTTIYNWQIYITFSGSVRE